MGDGFHLTAFILVEVMLVGAHAAGFTDFQLTDQIKGWVLTLVTAIFGVLSTLGVVQDPTTIGFEDRESALSYNK